MSRRIRRILLVCNNYDTFSLEEDGRIEPKISSEYLDLNLSNPPSIVRAESTLDALEMAEKGESFDLVITMYNVGALNVFDFSVKMKAIAPQTPIVLLCSYSKEIYRQISEADSSALDYVFCWNNSTDLIIAIIKLLEDRLNAPHDVLQVGVQAILLVEDSVRYYSTYLPMLYKIILQQNSESACEALNEQQQALRKRSRPKILLATNYEDAVALYSQYKDNLLGVISDIGFVLHKGDPMSSEKLDAGVDLCKLIRADNPKMPILMQSSQESMREVARELGVGFVMKQSKILTQAISDYISSEFGFGDFVLHNRTTGDEIARASDLLGLERIIKTIGDDELRTLAKTNYMSKWLKARGLFSLSKAFAAMDVEKDDSIEMHRKNLISVVKDYRINQGLGVVASFDADSFNDAIWFSRLGRGSMGGKARGLAFMYQILQRYQLYDRWEDVRVMVPRTMVITTEFFDRFIQDNGLKYVINSDLSDTEILSEFVSSRLPQELIDALGVFLRYSHKPLAIRSSSVLEDSYYQPFAGVYSTYMIPHTANRDQQIRLLSKAIKSVYSSVYYASSRSYIQATGNVISEEKMGIIIQEICGSEDSGYFFPTLSGVARSLNFYPIGHEEAEDGVVKVAMGLGKAVVDGDQVLRFCPKYPKHVLQTSTPELTMTDTQQCMYALDLHPDKFKTSTDDAVNLERIPISQCTKFRNLKYVASTFDFENGRIVDSTFPEGPKYVTFAQILRYNTFPLVEIIKELLDISAKEIKCYVEIEFAANLDKEGRKIFNVLQIRPISVDSRNAVVNWNEVDCSGAFLTSGSALGTGWIENVRDIVYLRPEKFDALKTREIAKGITALNARLRKEGRQYVLIGFGRWGSSIPSLGVPVYWSDISEAKVIVEASLDDFRIDPSQGTHFFQNLTSFNVGYINVDPYGRPKEDSLDFAVLDALPAVEETDYFRHVQLEQPLKICIDGKGGKAMLKIIK